MRSIATKRYNFPSLCVRFIRDVYVKVAYRIGLELFLFGLVAFDLRQPADAVALKTAMQGRTAEMG